MLASAASLDRSLPWSNLNDPWRVLVSEVMLQQTSVARVVPKWEQFCERYPTPSALAGAPLADVLTLWTGLGYPRRARDLHRAAAAIVENHGGQVPRSVHDLMALPGIGPYSARAVAAFAFAEPVGVLDTNVGRVLARCVTNRPLPRGEAQRIVDRLVDGTDPRRFNQSLLDIGAAHCRATARCAGCPLRDVCRWRRSGGDDPAVTSAGVSRPQAAFAGSDRQARGRLMARLAEGPLELSVALSLVDASDDQRAQRLMTSLAHDGLVSVDERSVRLGN